MNKLLFLFFFFITIPSLAQQKDTMEFSVHLNSVDPIFSLGNIHFGESKFMDGGNYTNRSYAFGLTFKYFLSNELAIRFRTIYTDRNIRDYRDITTGAHSIDDISFDQKLFKFDLGIQWSYFFKKFSFFGGTFIPLTIHSKLVETDYNFYETLDLSYQTTSTGTRTIPGGISTGLGLFVGSNFYVHKNFGVGFEFGSIWQYSKVGGTIRDEGITTGSVNQVHTYEYEESISEFKFTPPQFSLNLTLRI